METQQWLSPEPLNHLWTQALFETIDNGNHLSEIEAQVKLGLLRPHFNQIDKYFRQRDGRKAWA